MIQFQKPPISLMFFLILFLSLSLTWGYGPAASIASDRLPHVSSQMEKPEFWVKKIKNPGRVLLTRENIQKMNEEALREQDLYLCRTKDLKEEWTREEILDLLDEDWKAFGRTAEVRYGEHGSPLVESFWNDLTKRLNKESLKERNRILYGLIVNRTDIRVFPTEEISISTPTNFDFDRFQHSSIAPGSLVAIYHFSEDGRWAYVQTKFIRGWIRTLALTIANEKKEAVDYEEAKEQLVVTGSFVKVFGDTTLRQMMFIAQMGSTFPILDLPGKTPLNAPCYVIQIPFREKDGRLTLQKGYIPKGADVTQGFLPYTQENLARQAFKMLHEPYGWGEMYGGRDCSRFIMDIFSSFGIVMPRNSKFQARIGISLGKAEGISTKAKEKILDRAIPLTTTLRLPGHIMLYLGKNKGKYYAIHNVWGVQETGPSGPVLRKIGKAVVSDLSLGRSGPSQSLLHRITDIQAIVSDSEIQGNSP